MWEVQFVSWEATLVPEAVRGVPILHWLNCQNRPQEREPFEQSSLELITSELFDYIDNGKISEGQAQLVAIAPLLRLAGYSRPPIEYRVEENIATIHIEDQDTHIRGRFDIVAVNRTIQTTSANLLWILVTESKNIGASEYVGIAQMLTYAYSSLAHQKRVWGLVTNGANYQFFYI